MSMLILFVGLSGVDATAEILVRFPAGTDISHVSGTAKALERAVGVPILGVLAIQESEMTPMPLPPTIGVRLEKARAAYRKLELDTVPAILDGAETACLNAAPYETCREFLFEINMIKGMALLASPGKETSDADQAFRSAHIADPVRVLDPRRYPPNVIRAFANAWTGSEAIPKTDCSIVSNPKGVQLSLNGVPVRGDVLRLAPGRHVIEARFLGFEAQFQLVEIAPGTKGPITIRFNLNPETDVVAWKSLIREISNHAWQGRDEQVAALLTRFQISYVVLLARVPEDKDGLKAMLASASDRDFRSLPALYQLGPPVPDTFVSALMDAIGIEKPAAKTDAEAVVIGPSNADGYDSESFFDDEGDHDDDALDEDEDPSVRFIGGVDEEAGERRFTRVMKSPWLWISVGIVAAIVTGVVVSTQVED
jgi:hypothetical protein